jgi:hypothetical protein
MRPSLQITFFDLYLRMCSICISILGKCAIPHTESMCALKQASNCPVCGPSTHFPRFCPRRSRRHVSDKATAIPNEASEPNPPSVFMANSNTSYIEFLKSNDIKPTRKFQENKMLVELCLESRDPPCILRNPPVPRSQPVADSCCGLSHGANDGCVVRTVKVRVKKT